ncbi:Histidine kinase [Rubrivivax sp. A210]|uniref:sensor histidine kinase n=1 Tax=Rubrivivax sp. A210 TaxID=2772301 RepID=UPI00191A7882|nr:ATP-binding protein [Rubrivivax sp. A210]CAD5373163.1 Histidine kinase [Rubrivivax sp. A210]
MTHTEPSALARPGRLRRALLWGALLALLAVAQALLLALTISYESARAQDDADAVALEAAAELRRELLRQMQTLQTLAIAPQPRLSWRAAAQPLLASRHGLERVEWRDEKFAVAEAEDTPYAPTLAALMPRQALGLEAELACDLSRRAASPMFSHSYFVPLPDGAGVEVIDLCLPVLAAGRELGFLVGTMSLQRLLESALAPASARRYEISLIEGDGARLVRAGVPRGAGVYVAEHVINLPGSTLRLRADSAAGRPGLIPNLAVALVIGLSLALSGVVLLLARDVRRRAFAERALAEALAFRKAMEDSLSTGLRARDLEGRITYANPAFCAMVGYAQDELRVPPGRLPPYWPPEFAQTYLERQRLRLGGSRPAQESREGFETVFMRKNGERFPVMIYEAPLVDGEGRQTGWMSAVLDLSAQRRVEELSRQQQDRLQATARLATVGEMASLLSHELNQPLAAIASYAAGSLNMLDEPTPGAQEVEDRALLRQALERIAEQAERAGRVIKSVHDFVRRREQHHETLGVDLLIEAVLPLVRLQARKSGTRVEVDLPQPPARMPRVRCDRTMVEQVLLNLSRNGIQAMETATEPAARVLVLRVRQTHGRWVTCSVIDAGPGIAPEVAAKLFNPFFTTRAEGMGLGLSLCRTVIEQHGGALDFGPVPLARGTEFRFTLPAARETEPVEAPTPAPSQG